jgi:copper chaperone NosL
VNILNHYIGMKEIEPNEFPEFRFIPFLIMRFLALALLAMMVARLEIAALGWIDFVVFGIVMLVDFQHWLYEYGHTLSPDAPISIEPFTPRFIGTTQVANFHVASWPAVGAILMFIAGGLGPLSLVIEYRNRRKAD